MERTEIHPTELKVFMNHIYELKKGVRQMVLFTVNRKYEEAAVCRLRRQNIDFMVQPVDSRKVNLFFGKRECIHAIRRMVDRPLRRRTSYSVPCSDMTSARSANAIVCARRGARAERQCAT